MQVTLEEGGPRFASAAPSRDELQRQGASFVKLPRALFNDLHALVEAQKCGALPDDGERHVNELLHMLSAKVMQGQLGKPASYQ